MGRSRRLAFVLGALMVVCAARAQVKMDASQSEGAEPDPNGPSDHAPVSKEGATPTPPGRPGELVPAQRDYALPPQSDAGSGPRECTSAKRDEFPARRYGLSSPAGPVAVLGAIDDARLLKEDAQDTSPHRRARISVAQDADVSMGQGQWHEVPGVGRLWTVDIVSPGALGMRVHVRDLDLPFQSELWVYAPDHPEGADGPYRGRGPLGDGSMWSGTTEGERVRVELFVPGGADAMPFKPVRIDQVQHVYRDPVAEDPLSPAGTCDNDVTCFSTWTNVSHGTARLSFVENGNGFLCTGELLNSQNGDLTPYVLTSNNCIGTNAVAQTAQFFWLYQTASCNGAPPTLSSVPKSSVGTLVATGASSDFTILMEEGSLPCGLFWPGFDANAIATGQASSVIHHTLGGAKRISFGTKATADASVCSTGSPNFLRINWTDGMAASGAEGCGVYRNDTQRLYGQLSCGPATCASATFDNFGAMSATYSGSATVQTLLAGGSDDALEPNDTCATAITVSEGTFTNRVVRYLRDDWFKISVPAGGTLSAGLNFTNANGNIDMELYSTCGGVLLASSSGATNSESIVYNNPGGAANFLLHVFLADCDTRNAYTMVVATTLPNDACSDPTIIPGDATTFNPAPYPTTAADASGSEPQEGCEVSNAGVSNTVWYSFTPCGSGTVTIDTFGSTYDTVLSMFTGSCAAATQVACSDNAIGTQARLLNVAVTAGTTYLIKVADYNPTAGGGTLDFNFAYTPVAPLNEACAAAVVIPGNAAAFNPNPFCTVGATVTAGDPVESCGFTTNSNPVYYSFTPCADGRLTVDTNGSGYDTVLSIFSGSCAAPAEVACDDDSGTGLNSQLVNVPVTGGATYLIKVSDFGNPDGGTLDFNFSYVPSNVPVNDNCTSPTAIPTGTSFAPGTYCTMAAGATTSEPQESCEVGGVGVSNTVWYSFAPCADGTISLDTNGSNFDTVLSVFSGACASAAQVACDDDSGTGSNSQLTNVPVIGGTRYLIKIADYGGPNGGSLVFHFAYAAPVAVNDLCSAATLVTSSYFQPPATCVTGATITPDEPAELCGAPPNSSSVWYRFVPGQSGPVAIDTIGSDYATVVSLFSGSCATATPVACDDTGGPDSAISASLTAGQTYLIKVSSLGSSGAGSLDFNLVFGGGAGRVASRGADAIRVDKSGSDLTLGWGPSCVPGDHDYAVYEGTLGTYYSHSAILCSTSGGTSASFAPGSGNRYYLVAPLNGSFEGSYGVRSNGAERPIGSGECSPQVIAACPPTLAP